MLCLSAGSRNVSTSSRLARPTSYAFCGHRARLGPTRATPQPLLQLLDSEMSSRHISRALLTRPIECRCYIANATLSSLQADHLAAGTNDVVLFKEHERQHFVRKEEGGRQRSRACLRTNSLPGRLVATPLRRGPAGHPARLRRCRVAPSRAMDYSSRHEVGGWPVGARRAALAASTVR